MVGARVDCRARRPSSYGRRVWSADARREDSFTVSCFVSCLEMLLQVVTLFVLVESFCDGESRSVLEDAGRQSRDKMRVDINGQERTL